MTANDAFCQTAVRMGLVTETQAQTCLRDKAADVPVERAFVDGGLMTAAQVLTVIEQTRLAAGQTGARRESSLIGRTLGGCLLVQKIGEGGMGAVFKANHLGLEKTVAVKILPEHLTADADLIARFLREARALARVEHPNIVTVHHAGEEGGIHFLVMQFLEGRNLADCVRERPLAPDEAARIGRGVAEGLHAAHRAGIIHRDLKPENIILLADGVPKIVDFGLARETARREFTQTGQVLGSPLYMAPEQCLGRDVDARTDLYALGATLFTAVTGDPPYSRTSLYEIFEQHIHAPPPDPRAKRPDLPDPLARIVMRLMMKDAAQRYPDAKSVVADFDRFLAGQTVRALPCPSRAPRVAIAAVVVVALALAALVALTRRGREAPSPPAVGGPIGRVLVRSTPPGAAISIDGLARGRTPREIDGLERREHELRLALDGYAPKTVRFSLEGPEPLVLDPALDALGTLVLSCQAYGRRVRLSGLTILLDGERAGADAIPLVPGREHRVRIQHEQIVPREFTLRAGPGERVPHSVELEAVSPWNGMVLVAPGEFRSGEERVRQTLGPFYIDLHEVTCAQYAAHMQRTRAQRPRVWPGKDDAPVCSVTWAQAREYAESCGKRLPTALEWEKAARGTDARTYPWGDTFDSARTNTLEAGRREPCPVATLDDVSPCGCRDMAGNVREWTGTPGRAGHYVVMGASFDDRHTFARTWSRRDVAATDSSRANGFRCAADFLPGLLED